MARPLAARRYHRAGLPGAQACRSSCSRVDWRPEVRHSGGSARVRVRGTGNEAGHAQQAATTVPPTASRPLPLPTAIGKRAAQQPGQAVARTLCGLLSTPECRCRRARGRRPSTRLAEAAGHDHHKRPARLHHAHDPRSRGQNYSVSQRTVSGLRREFGRRA